MKLEGKVCGCCGWVWIKWVGKEVGAVSCVSEVGG